MKELHGRPSPKQADTLKDLCIRCEVTGNKQPPDDADDEEDSDDFWRP
jgi:hypothetical protein